MGIVEMPLQAESPSCLIIVLFFLQKIKQKDQGVKADLDDYCILSSTKTLKWLGVIAVSSFLQISFCFATWEIKDERQAKAPSLLLSGMMTVQIVSPSEGKFLKKMEEI